MSVCFVQCYCSVCFSFPDGNEIFDESSSRGPASAYEANAVVKTVFKIVRVMLIVAEKAANNHH